MPSKQSIIETLYFGLMDYVPKKKLIEYKNEFSSRKRHNTKFALSFFPKYIDFDKAIKKPKSHYDTLLLNYWIVEVPNAGLIWSKLISDYEYEKNSITNKRIKAERNNAKTRTKLLLTKKQKEERRKKKLDLTKEPVLHGEVIRRIKSDPEYAAKIKAIALKNSQKKSQTYKEKMMAMTQEQKAKAMLILKRRKALKNVKEKKASNPYRKDANQAVKAREELSNLPESLQEREAMTAQVWAAHGKPNPNPPRNKDNTTFLNKEQLQKHKEAAKAQKQQVYTTEKEKLNVNIINLIKLILSFLFFVALFKMPYNYYETMRFIAMVAFIVLGYGAINNKNKIFMLIWFSSALLVNPFLKLALGRTLWNIIDVIWIILLVFTIFHNKKD